MKRTPAKAAKATRAPADGWQDLRDADGKLCARIELKTMTLEIRRSDRRQVASFDLCALVAAACAATPKKD